MISKPDLIPVSKEPLVRYSEPNQYDHAPYGTECIVIKRHGKPLRFIQMSREEERPQWVSNDMKLSGGA